MILAAPLVIPFAEAVGISIATLGMAKAADMVNDYIQENPEQSAMILKTLVPNLGIGEIFMNKEDSGDDEEVSEEEVTESESGSTKDMVLEELNKEKGNYSDPEAKGNYASPRGRIIGRLRREGKIRQGNDPNYDPSKKYQGYKRFIRPKKADGGAIGIEVLFEEKKPRKNFFMGGPALTGQPLAIYNSMSAYNSFTDQEIADAIKEAGYSLPTADSGTTPPGSTPGNNLGYQSGNERQGGIMDLDPYSNAASPRNQSNTSSKYSVAEIEKGIDIYGNPIDESITSKGFNGSAMDKFSNLPGIKQGKNLINTIMDNTLVGRLAAMRNPLNPNASNYNPSLQGQIDMLEGMTGSRITGTSGNLKTTEGLAMLGRDPNSGLGKYGPGSVLAGQNVVSGFGTNDYEDQLQGYIDKMISRGTLSQFQKAKLDQAYKELERAQQGALERVDALNKQKAAAKAAGEAKKARDLQIAAAAKAQEISRSQARQQQAAIERDQQRDSGRGGGANQSGGGYSSGSGYNEGNYCFDPSTPIQMADGSTKEIKNIQLGDDTKGGEVTGVFQFKASDEIHDYKGVTVAGSHYVKEDGRFIMVKDSPLSVKIDKIPVVYSLDTTGRRIFINDIEFADYNGDGVAKNFLTNAGVDLTGFDTEVLRQVENRLI